MKYINRIPVFVAYLVVLALTFTFVDYKWLTFEPSRFLYALTGLFGSLVLTIMNREFKFWGYRND